MTDWKRTVNIKDLIDPSQTADVVALQIRDRLVKAFNGFSPFGRPDMEFANILADFEDVETVEDCNAALGRLYDWADAERVWLGL